MIYVLCILLYHPNSEATPNSKITGAYCIGLCKLKCTEKRFIPFPPIHFLPEFVPHTEFKGRPEDTKWNVLYHTALRNYAAVSLQVPSILSILLGWCTACKSFQPMRN